jgi:hypothetical protein
VSANKKQLALKALERAVDALRGSEYDKAHKLTAVSQKLQETMASITVTLCIEVARQSTSTK